MRPTAVYCLVAGERVQGAGELIVRNPFHKGEVGSVKLASRQDVEQAVRKGLAFTKPLTRFERSQILDKARIRLESERETFAYSITSESGLALREARYEVGRTIDVLRFAAIEALRDDGQMFACDVSAQGKARRIFTTREPLQLALAITPFNHPLNQAAHKVCPAIAAGTPLILKPSEKTPLTAIRFVELLYECGLPGPMLSVLLGPTAKVASPLVTDERVELVSFTGSVAVGKKIATLAGYKKVVLELGGNDPLIILPDADLDLAVHLAAEGSYRNSGQRCTAVKRILVHSEIADSFTERLTQKTKEYICGDPFDEKTIVGTVIDEPAAQYLEEVVKDAVSMGACVHIGGTRNGALMHPTVLSRVSPTAQLVACESFGPLAPIMTFDTLDEAIQLANGVSYGLSSGVVTNNLDAALRCIRQLRCGTVNINEVPGYRVENSPFGGIKDSGLGIKEGVIEAMKLLSYVKTFSLPW